MAWEWLYGALFILLLITLIGHRIRVFVARLFKAGKAPPQFPGDYGDELFRAELQIDRLAQAGLLDEATRQRVSEAFNLARQRQTPPPLAVLPLAAPPFGSSLSSSETTDAPAAPTFAARDERPTELPSVPRSAVTAAPIAPAKPFSQVVASFMRQSNIRYGELVGGLLIVGCSIALVISFWNQIRGHALLQFGIFTGVTAALMGLGLYAEHRWKLPTTSRGILLIATLLVPLNFLALAAVARGGPPSAVLTVAEVAALGLFGFLVWQGSSTLAPYWPRLMSAGVIAASASIVIIRQVGPAHSPGGLLALGALPVGAYVVGMGTVLVRARRWRRISGRVADALFLLLAVLTFGTALGTALVIFQTDAPLRAARRLAPLLSFGTAPALASGLLIWRRVTGRKLAGVRTAGTAIALAASFIMVGTIALSWPDAVSMLPLAVGDFLALTLVALLFEFPAVHAMGGVCLLLAYLVGFHVARHHVGWTSTPSKMLDVLLSPAGGAALIPLFLLTCAASFFLARRNRAQDSRAYAAVGIAVACVSLGLTSWGGFARRGDPFGVTWVYLSYAIFAAIVTWRWLRTDASWASWVLLLASVVQFLIARRSGGISWSEGLLAYGTLSVAVWLIACQSAHEALKTLARPVRWITTLASAAAAILLVANLSVATAGLIWPQFLWLAAVWTAMSFAEGSAGLFGAGQIAVVAAASIAVVSVLARYAWFRQTPDAMSHPWTLQCIGVAVGALCLGWSALRRALPGKFLVRQWLDRTWSVDRVLALLLIVGLGLLAVYAVIPGITAEFSTTRLSLAPLSHRYAAGAGSWAVLAVLLLAFSLRLGDRTWPPQYR